MKNLFYFLSSIIISSLFVFSSCKNEQAEELPTPNKTELKNYYTPSQDDLMVTNRSGYWTEIPAGSVDALAAAIAEADAGGVVYLKAGMHTENNRITINKPMSIIGEDGAVLEISSSDDDGLLSPGIYVLNAAGTVVQNIEIRPLQTTGECGVMFENSPQSAVLSCKISDFDFGVFIEESDRVAIINNDILNSGSNAIMALNGESTYIADNYIENTTFSAVWLNDKWGTLERNTFENNQAALLCKYAEVFGNKGPGGNPLFAQNPATGWKVRMNEFNNGKEGMGLSIRDGSNLNLIENNSYSGNTLYDIIIQPDETFPFDPPLFVPAGYKNTINAHPDVIIKDCGVDNIINGGTMVDASVDPC